MIPVHVTILLCSHHKANHHLSDDLFRDPITGELFADPVFCDKGHTHERSSIERHFHARREMKADEEKD
jgi:hypothetical protein